mmetsp:Transcript_102220/g.187305  ORF Transcript_102220/g.187305 Transcript_102220/m.187305 type:complete len:353 (+) Transcript_102220:35-1093(+)
MGCIGSRKSESWEQWYNKEPMMTDKVVAITGTTSGTGFVLAQAVAKKGGKVICLNRKSERADESLKSVKEVAIGPIPVAIDCDLMSFESTRKAGEKLAKEYGAEGIDVLVNNAGIMGFKDVATEDGYDQQMQTNHLSHFLLTYLCMPALETAAKKRGEARIVNHSSAARCMKDMENKLDAKYLDRNGGNLGGDSTEMFAGPQFQRYQQTKLANVCFTYALEKKLAAKGSKIKALVAHPGVSLDTKLMVHTFEPDKGGVTPVPVPTCLLKRVLGAQSREDATIGILYCTCDPDAKSGEFFGPLGKGGATLEHDTTEYSGPVGLLKREETLGDQAAQDTCWTMSEKATGIKFNI